MINIGSILKSREITLPTKVCLIRAMVFPVVMYGCESCTKKKLTDSKLGKEYDKAVYCHPVYLTYMQSSVQFSRSVLSDSL